MYVCMYVCKVYVETFDTDVCKLRHGATRIGVCAILNLQHRPNTCMYVRMREYVRYARKPPTARVGHCATNLVVELIPSSRSGVGNLKDSVEPANS